MITLTKYYRNAAVFPLVFIATIGIISGIVHDILGIGKDYKSEWFTNDGYWVSVFFATLLSILICLLSTTIYLNKLDKVKQNVFLCLIAWFLLPMLLIGYILTTHISYVINYQEKFDLENIFVLTLTLPHLISLTITFYKFRNNLRQ
jgi:hypothetical protein